MSMFQERASVGAPSGKRDADDPMATPDEVWVVRARNGDKTAAGMLFDRYRDRAFAIAFRMSLGDREEARDITQEAFLNAFRHLGSFKNEARFYTWFYRILINTCLDARRRRKQWWRLFGDRHRNDPEHELMEVDRHPDPGENPSDALCRRALEEDVRRAMKSLSHMQRMIFTLKIFEEMRIPEIARLMEIAEGTVKSHLFRATRIMREHLSAWSDTEGQSDAGVSKS